RTRSARRATGADRDAGVVHRSTDPRDAALCWDGCVRTEEDDADEAQRVAPGRTRWWAAARSLTQVWRIEDRRNDLFSAVTTFVLGWVLLEVGLVGLVRAPFVVEPAEPWWRVAL